jgi:hydrogenase expression/formation protein HypC
MVGRVTRVWDEDGVPMALVRGDDREQPACLLYVPEAIAGSYVLVHAGFAVELLEPADAQGAGQLPAGEEVAR